MGVERCPGCPSTPHRGRGIRRARALPFRGVRARTARAAPSTKRSPSQRTVVLGARALRNCTKGADRAGQEARTTGQCGEEALRDSRQAVEGDQPSADTWGMSRHSDGPSPVCDTRGRTHGRSRTRATAVRDGSRQLGGRRTAVSRTSRQAERDQSRRTGSMLWTLARAWLADSSANAFHDVPATLVDAETRSAASRDR